MLGLVMPALGDKPLTSIQPPDVLDALRAIERSGRLETLHRVKARISEVFRYAIATGRAVSDPTRDLRGALKPKRPTRHFAALTEPQQVGDLLRAIDGYTGTPEVRAALKLAPLLFVRPGELRAAQWSQFELDSDAPTWRYFVSKTKVHHIVPLSAQAVAILRELQPLTGAGLELKPDAPRYVFPGARSRLRPMSENAVTAALRSLGYTGEQMTGHGFRATARTLLAEMGWMPDIIERQLAHKPAGPLGAAYDRATFLVERRKLMQAWADYLDGLRRGAVIHGRFGKAA
jgi:integrase